MANKTRELVGNWVVEREGLNIQARPAGEYAAISNYCPYADNYARIELNGRSIDVPQEVLLQICGKAPSAPTKQNPIARKPNIADEIGTRVDNTTWLTPIEPMATKRKPVYVAHPLGNGSDRVSNRARASAWVCFLAERYLVSPVADWIVLSGQWDESYRELGLACDRVLVELCGTVILCGPHISQGMKAELEWAKKSVDLTGIAKESLGGLSIIDTLMAGAGFLRAS